MVNLLLLNLTLVPKMQMSKMPVTFPEQFADNFRILTSPILIQGRLYGVARKFYSHIVDFSVKSSIVDDDFKIEVTVDFNEIFQNLNGYFDEYQIIFKNFELYRI